MRCKNCGFDNNEGRYICENCGSPLFDDDGEIIPEDGDLQNEPPHKLDEPEDPYAEDDEDEKLKNKKNIIIIIVLAVILVAMIVGIIVAAVVNKKDETTTDPSVSITTDANETETQKTTRSRTTTERTTESTTERTTTTTERTTTTTVARYTVTVDVDGTQGGSVTGAGTFEAGSRTTLVATVNDGYQFAGWYDNDTGSMVASGTSYTITVNSNRSLTARFTQLPSQEEPSNEQGQ